MTRARQSHIFAKERNGHYVEPLWCSQRLLEVEDFGPQGSVIYDPSMGFGTILHSVKAAGYRPWGSDIVDRRPKDFPPYLFRKLDFLNCAKPPRSFPMSIICNPPFTRVQEFCERAVDLAHIKVAMICLLRRLPAAHWLDSLPLETIYMLSPRPSMPTGAVIRKAERGEIDPLTGERYKVGGGTQDFVWLVFTKGYRGNPTMKWLRRDGDV